MKIGICKVSKIIFLKIFLAALFLCDIFAQEAIVAIVNNEIITQQDLSAYINFLNMQAKQSGSPDNLRPDSSAMEESALNQLIEDKLILSEARTQGVLVREDAIEAKVNEIKQGFPTEDEFMNYLRSQGLTLADTKEKFKEQVMMFAMIEKEVKSKISINPQDATDYYYSHQNEFIEKEKRDVDVLIFQTKEDLQEAEKILKEAQAAGKIEESLGNFNNSVNLGKVASDEIKKEFSDVVFALEKGNISSSIALENKFYIFFVKEISPQHQITLEQAQTAIHNILWKQAFQNQYDIWMGRLRKKATISIKDKTNINPKNE